MLKRAAVLLFAISIAVPSGFAQATQTSQSPSATQTPSSSDSGLSKKSRRRSKKNAATLDQTAAPGQTTQSSTQAVGGSRVPDAATTSSNRNHTSAPVGTDASAPQGATAKCKDGTYSKSAHHSGACSHHGGVAEWLGPAAK